MPHPAAPTKLIMCQPLGDGRRLLIEISPDDSIKVACWDGARQGASPCRLHWHKRRGW